MDIPTACHSPSNATRYAKAPGAASATDMLESLRAHPLFRILSERHFNEIALRVRPIDLDHHDLLYRQDTDAEHFYFVVSGRIRLYRLDYSGFERTLDSIPAGDCVAEVMIYANPPRYACYAESLKHSSVLSIPIAAYRALIHERPAYAEAALTHYASRAISRFQDLEIMTVQSARERLLRYLMDLAPTAIDGEIELPLPKCQIASRLAMQPETLSRQLNDLSKNGLLRVEGNRLIIPDLKQLTQPNR